MNRDDIIRMAREAGGVRCDCCLPEPEGYEMSGFLERFAALVAAAEREAVVRKCAATVENFYQEDRFDCRSARTEILDHFGIER